MSFLSKVTKGISNAAKSIGNAVKSVATGVVATVQKAAPIAALIPGIGPLFTVAAGVAGSLLGPSPPKQVAQPAQLAQVPMMAAAALPLGPLLALGALLFFSSRK